MLGWKEVEPLELPFPKLSEALVECQRVYSTEIQSGDLEQTLKRATANLYEIFFSMMYLSIGLSHTSAESRSGLVIQKTVLGLSLGLAFVVAVAAGFATGGIGAAMLALSLLTSAGTLGGGIFHFHRLAWEVQKSWTAALYNMGHSLFGEIEIANQKPWQIEEMIANLDQQLAHIDVRLPNYSNCIPHTQANKQKKYSLFVNNSSVKVMSLGKSVSVMRLSNFYPTMNDRMLCYWHPASRKFSR